MAGSAGAIRAGRAFVEIFADDSKLQQAVTRASKSLRDFGQAASRMGAGMAAVSAAMLAPMAIATRTFAGFSDEMATVQAVTGATGKAFEALTDQAKELGRTTSFTASQVAQGMTALGRAGFDAAEIQAATPAMLNLARATGTDLGAAAGIAASALRGFRMEATDTTRIADVLVAVANNSAQTLDDLGQSLSYVGPIAAAAGESIESTSVALGVMANMGIKGSMAGTAMRQMLLKIADPAIQQQLHQLGVEADFVTGNLGEVMGEIAGVMATMSRGEQIDLAQQLFGTRAATAAIGLTGGVEQVEKLREAIANAGGAAADTAATMDATLGGAFRRLWSAVEGAQIAIGGALAPEIERLSKWITDVAGRFSAWAEKNTETIVTVAKLAAGLGVLGIALLAAGKLAFAASAVIVGLTAVVKGLSVALLFLAANPIGAVLAVMGLLIIGIGAYSLLAGGAADETQKLVDAQKAAAAESRKQLSELEALSKKEELNSEEKDRALALIEQLEQRYGELGIRMDETTGKIEGMADAQERLNGAMEAANIAELEAQLTKLNEEHAEQAAKAAEMEAKARTSGGAGSFGGMAGAAYNEDARRARERMAAIEDERRRINELLSDISAHTAEASGDVQAEVTNAMESAIRSFSDVNQSLHDEIARLYVDAIEDPFIRALQRIEQQYIEKMRRAEEAGQDLALVEQAYELAIENAMAAENRRMTLEAQGEHDRQAAAAKSQADAAQSIQDRIDMLKLDRDIADEQERAAAKLELDRQKALRSADTDEQRRLVEEEFALRKELLGLEQTATDPTSSARGTFSAAAAAMMGRGAGADPMLQKADKQIDLLQNILNELAGNSFLMGA